MSFRPGEKISSQAQANRSQPDDNSQIHQRMKQHNLIVFRHPGIDDGAREVEAVGHRYHAAQNEQHAAGTVPSISFVRNRLSVRG